MNAYQKVQLARSNLRPDANAYISRLIEGFIELHGDRRYADDAAVVAGLGYF